MFQPFIDSDHFLQEWFPEKIWAIAVPTIVGILFLSVILTFDALVMISAKLPVSLPPHAAAFDSLTANHTDAVESQPALRTHAHQ